MYSVNVYLLLSTIAADMVGSTLSQKIGPIYKVCFSSELCL